MDKKMMMAHCISHLIVRFHFQHGLENDETIFKLCKFSAENV